MKTNTQTSSSIDVLDFPDNVRKKPSMYMGPKGNAMAFVCVREVMDNSVDEYLAGRNSTLEVYVSNKDNEYIVCDKGQGIPVEIHSKTKISTLTTVFTKLHAGGKLHADEGSYKVSRGTHGVGASATNALSESFEVWTFRDCWYYQKFEQGLAKTKVLQQKPPKEVTSKLQNKYSSGTIIRVCLDKKIIREDKEQNIKVSSKEILNWLKNTALMISGIKVYASVDGRVKQWHNTKGIIAMLKNKAKRLGDPESFTKSLVVEEKEYKLALQWFNRAEDDGMAFYVNALPTALGGEHEQGFVAALSKSIEKFAGKKIKFSSRDLLHGLVGVFNIDLPSPEFSGQTKEKLTTKCSKQVEEFCLKKFDEFFRKNKSSAKKIIKRAQDVKKTKDEYKKLMTAVSDIKKGSKLKLSSKLAQSPKCKPEERELYIVEGDSAAGCFSGKTKVKLANGKSTEIENLVNNPLLGICLDQVSNKKKIARYDNARITKYTKNLVKLFFEDGSFVECTPEHKILTTKGWLQAKDCLNVETITI